jgi:hypothetical protein
MTPEDRQRLFNWIQNQIIIFAVNGRLWMTEQTIRSLWETKSKPGGEIVPALLC